MVESDDRMDAGGECKQAESSAPNVAQQPGQYDEQKGAFGPIRGHRAGDQTWG